MKTTKVYQAWTRKVRTGSEPRDQFVTTLYRCESKKEYLEKQAADGREVEGGLRGIKVAYTQTI